MTYSPQIDVLSKPRQHREALAIREIEAAWFRCDPIADALRAGWSAERVTAVYGATYREIKRARQRLEQETV